MDSIQAFGAGQLVARATRDLRKSGAVVETKRLGRGSRNGLLDKSAYQLLVQQPSVL